MGLVVEVNLGPADLPLWPWDFPGPRGLEGQGKTQAQVSLPETALEWVPLSHSLLLSQLSLRWAHFPARLGLEISSIYVRNGFQPHSSESPKHLTLQLM